MRNQDRIQVIARLADRSHPFAQLAVAEAGIDQHAHPARTHKRCIALAPAAQNRDAQTQSVLADPKSS
jgi:hypothetical protein